MGNKSDLEDERDVPQEEGKQLADSFGILFIEASAKTSYNVNELFFQLVRQINKWRDDHPDRNPIKKKKKGCSIV